MWANGEDAVVLVGCGGFRGGVIAGEERGGQVRRMSVPAARPGTPEALLHEQVGRDALVVVPTGDRPGRRDRRLDHRAIGVVYRAERERWGNDVPSE
jgi:erythromycin esterase-like protein